MSARKSTRKAARTPEDNAASAEEQLRSELIAIKERIEDLLDSHSPSARKSPKQAAARNVRSRSRGMGDPRLAIVVGHTATAGGGSGLPPADPSEYPWNSDLAEKIQAAGAAAGVEVRVFFRDGVGISGAYKRVAAWNPVAAIELHYNNGGGQARGSETLWGPACRGSQAWAAAIQASMVALYKRTGKQDRGLLKAPPYDRGVGSVNALSSIPSCLIEPFFGDNASDAALGGAKKTELAETLVATFTRHFSIGEPVIPKAIVVEELLGDFSVEKILKAIPVEEILKAIPVEKILKAIPVEQILKVIPVDPQKPVPEPAPTLPPVKTPLAPGEYAPPASAAKFISGIDLTPAKAFDPGEQIKGLTHLRVLAGDVVYLDTDLATDADGSPRATKIDPTGQLETAYNFPGQTGQACFPDAERIPYIVLAGSNTPAKRPKDKYLYNRLGLKLGDIAAVIWKDRIEFAMFADASANNNLGEGSVALVESLGWNPWNNARTRIISGIPGPGVLTFVFPGSRIPGITPKNAAAEIRKKGAELFKSIGGTLA